MTNKSEVSIAGPRLRETLTWLEIDVSGVPPDKLQRLDLRGTLAATDKGLYHSIDGGLSWAPRMRTMTSDVSSAVKA